MSDALGDRIKRTPGGALATCQVSGCSVSGRQWKHDTGLTLDQVRQ
ncbi:gp132 [Mycobacterium phage Omega]|uniref:Uncharacterized protein n=1 Tax=Mycobacterium phage Omega TaxID=2907835 RepID=Q854D6_BPMOM|nr:gp132 [Mycobacterium phage Omega]AAN12772.1 hypothetical protein PBI_OMEGA_132 [Mycobacterium phage Omega]